MEIFHDVVKYLTTGDYLNKYLHKKIEFMGTSRINSSFERVRFRKLLNFSTSIPEIHDRKQLINQKKTPVELKLRNTAA